MHACLRADALTLIIVSCTRSCRQRVLLDCLQGMEGYLIIYDMYSRVKGSLPPLVRVDVTSVCSDLQSLAQSSGALWLQDVSVLLQDKADQTQKHLHPGSVFFLLDLNCLGHSGLVLAQSLSFLPALFPEQALSEAAKARGLVHARPWYVARRELHLALLRADSGDEAVQQSRLE